VEKYNLNFDMHFVHELQNFILQFQHFHIHFQFNFKLGFTSWKKWLNRKQNRQILCGSSFWEHLESERPMQDKYQRTASLLPISYTVSNICTVFTPKSIKACIIHLQTWLELLDFWSWTCKVLFERIDSNLWDYKNWNGWHLFNIDVITIQWQFVGI
jgi:hypothetical protein